MLLTTTATADVTVTKLDGTSMSGSLRGWADGQLLLETEDGQTTVPEARVLSIKWSVGQTPPPPNSATVELVDDSVLPIISYRTAGPMAVIVPSQASASSAAPLRIPVDGVRSVRLLPLSGDVAEQWEEIRGLNLPSDLLVILKRDGQSLDYVEGVIGAVTDTDVEFTLDEQPVHVSREKLAGVVYYRADAVSGPTPRCILHGQDGIVLTVARVELAGDELQLSTVGGAKLAWPVDEMRFADFSAGKVAFLSDMGPASEQWTPWIELPAAAALASEYGQVRRDESAYGGPLSLAIDEDGVNGGEQTFAKGLAVRSRTELVYRLPRGYHRFVALVGIEPATRSSGNVVLKIAGDGRPLFAQTVAGDRPPLPVECDISGVKRLTIVVDYGENLDTGDWLNLCNARIVK